MAHFLPDEAADMRRAAVRYAVRDHFESTLERYELTGDPAPYMSRALLVEAMALAYEEVAVVFEHGLLTRRDLATWRPRGERIHADKEGES